jgi:multiple sugar transport system substrate-binding protein
MLERSRRRRSGHGVWRLCATLISLLWLARPALADDGRVHVKYWEKWTGFEREAMRVVVDDFNRSQDRIVVDFIGVSSVNQKTIVATAGGNPPDLAGVWGQDVIDFADKEALIPLDEFARGTVVRRDRYLPLYWDMGVTAGHLFGVISAPAITALHWNKRLFREAGLDPERPPRTIAELDRYADRLTRFEGGKLTRIGFLPSEPPWWPFFWPYFFGGSLWDGGEHIPLESPQNVRAYTWVQGYAKKYGVEALQTAHAGFGNFASAQDPFMSGHLGMVLQGIWMSNYIASFAPDLEWAAAPFPPLHEGDDPVTFVDADMLVIPRGARHPREAFEFIRYLAEQPTMEKFCVLQHKNSPLRDVSEDFFQRHKNPFIRMFQKLAGSPKAAGMPQMAVWKEYRVEMQTLFQKVWLVRATPEQALHDAGVRMQRSWDRARQRRSVPPAPWLERVPFALIALALLAIGVAIGRERRRELALHGRAGAVRSNASLAKGLAFMSPWGIGLLLFTAYPVLASAVYSFCDYSVLSAPRFIGLSNYLELWHDEVFFIALKNTLLYAAFSLPLGLFSSLFIALLLDSNVRGSSLYRTLVFLPSLTPLVASAMVWLWIFNARYGILNQILGKLSFGLIPPVPWLADPRTALPSIILMSVWSVGHTVVILLAAMQDVPTAIYEAADIDGASAWRKVWHITVPLVSPAIYFNSIMGTISALQVFAQPYIMTNGGPARATLSYAMRLYDNAFTFLRMGYAAAMAWILFVIILGLTLIAVRFGQRRVHYTAG